MPNTPGRRHRRTMRIFHVTYGNGPWVCEECNLPIVKIGRARFDGNVHHRDDDVTNDTPSNLCPLHTVCHLRLHAPTEEMKIQIAAKLKGRPSPTKGMKFSDEVNAKKSMPGETNPYYGRMHPPEVRAKMRQPRKRVICDNCSREFAINWVKRHQCQT